MNLGKWSTIEEVTGFFPGIAQWHNWVPDGPVETWGAQLPPQAKLVFEVVASDRAQAADLAGRLQRLRDRAG